MAASERGFAALLFPAAFIGAVGQLLWGLLISAGVVITRDALR